MPVQSFRKPEEAVHLPGSDLARLEWSESEQREPMQMALTRHHFARTFTFAVRTLAAHEASVVQKAT
jgi:hypothetical protein